MVHDNILVVLSLLFAVILLQALSKRLGVSFPILLVLGGLGISLIPGLPVVRMDPDLVLLLILPPLLYEAAWYTSWKDFWHLRIAIFLQAFGLVLFTSTAVAVAAHAAGFPWAVGFLLGGIISPPDAVAASSVLKGLAVPKNAVTLLEGESLVNDASSLVVFRFALAAILTGQFSFGTAAGQFLVVAIGGIVIGLAIALAMFALHRKLKASPSTDTTLTLMSPYLMYMVAERFHTSGVLAVVAGGLYLSARSHEFLQGSSGVEAKGVWSTTTFLLNGIVFVMIGLQLPAVAAVLGPGELRGAVLYGLAASLLAVVVRIVWVFSAAYARQVVPGMKPHQRVPSWKFVFLVAWAGMRGVVSLASALAIPLTLDDGSAFPHRPLLVVVTFVVILFTLVVQGLSLPAIIRWLRFDSEGLGNHHEQRHALAKRLAEVSLAHLRAHYTDVSMNNDRIAKLLEHYESALHPHSVEGDNEHDAEANAHAKFNMFKKVVRELAVLQREEVIRLRRAGIFDHEVTLAREHALDLELARIEQAAH